MLLTIHYRVGVSIFFLPREALSSSGLVDGASFGLFTTFARGASLGFLAGIAVLYKHGATKSNMFFLFVAFLMQIYLFFSSLPLFFSISIRTYRLLHPVYFLWILCCLGFGF